MAKASWPHRTDQEHDWCQLRGACPVKGTFSATATVDASSGLSGAPLNNGSGNGTFGALTRCGAASVIKVEYKTTNDHSSSLTSDG